MTLSLFKARNHPQQVGRRGPRPEVDDRGTDPALFAALDRRFGFTVDACATASNAKLERFWTPEQDGLKQDWAGERVWCNPPYSSIEPWVAKAWEEVWWGALIVMLLPANRTEQGWWQDRVEPYRDIGGPLRVEFLRGRLRFVAPGAERIGPNERPPFGCCLLIFENSVTFSGRSQAGRRT